MGLNLRTRGCESCPWADAENRGATLVHLSLGATLDLTPARQVHVFVQEPVAQRVSGLPFEPWSSVSWRLRWTSSPQTETGGRPVSL